MSKDYEIGRGKPPKHTQFKPGRSGNPKGRKPKPTRAITERQIRADVLGTMEREVTIMLDGKSRKVPFFVAAVYQLLKLAANGDFRAIKLVIELRRDMVNEHIDALVSLQETLIRHEEWLREDPESVPDEVKIAVKEMKRRIRESDNLG